MIKHLVKIIWNQRRRNGWIAAEILLVFVVLWYIIDSLMAVGKVFFAPMGWDIDHVYWISMGVEEVDRNEMDSTYRYVTSGRRGGGRGADVHAAYGREPVHAGRRERFYKC